MYLTMTHPARATYDAKTLAYQDAFLAAYAKVGTVSKAAEGIPINHDHVYNWVSQDHLGFRERYHKAQREFAEYLEDLALQRVANPTNNGRTGSDVLLIAMLNANHPTKWRRDTVVVGSDAAKQLIDKLTQLAAKQRPQAIDVDASPQATIARMLAPGGEKALDGE